MQYCNALLLKVTFPNTAHHYFITHRQKLLWRTMLSLSFKRLTLQMMVWNTTSRGNNILLSSVHKPTQVLQDVWHQSINIYITFKPQAFFKLSSWPTFPFLVWVVDGQSLTGVWQRDNDPHGSPLIMSLDE